MINTILIGCSLLTCTLIASSHPSSQSTITELERLDAIEQERLDYIFSAMRNLLPNETEDEAWLRGSREWEAKNPKKLRLKRRERKFLDSI